jgi:cytoskeleton protein RodZ
MSHEDTQEEIQSLGAFLREHREQKGASLTEACEATKISLPVLKAIEEDAYERMPAEAFCRGFYSLYASFLELDPKIILEQYEASKETVQKSSKKPAKPPVKKSRSCTNYAEPSSISPATSLTIFTVACLITVAGICWYFNWNPVDYINTKLMLPQPSMEQEQTQAAQQTPAAPLPDPAAIEAGSQGHGTESFNENEATAGITNKEEAGSLEPLPPMLLSETNDKVIEELPEKAQTASPAVAPYHLEIYFSSNGTLKVTLDDGFVLDKHFSAGETLQWEVEKKIILDMPETISGTLRLNEIEIPLPEAENGRRMLSLPEDLLD